MSKKVLRDLFLFSDEDSYKWHKPKNDDLLDLTIEDCINGDFEIWRNAIFFKYLTTRKDGYIISRMMPKIGLFLVFAIAVTVLTLIPTLIRSASTDETVMSLGTFLIVNGIVYGHFLLIYLFYYWKNYDIIKKYNDIKKSINRRKTSKCQKSMKDIANDIIDNNIKLMRKLKLKNLEDK